MGDEHPYRLHYGGAVLGLPEDMARYVHQAIQKVTTEKATVVVRMEYLPAGQEFTELILGPGIPVMLSGPAFTVTDIVDRP